MANPKTEKVCKIFSEVLAVEPVDLNDNFFSLGGDSRKAVQLINRVIQEFKISLPMELFFQTPSPQGLCDILSGKNIAIDRIVVRMARGRNYAPVFLVHPLDGYVSPYAHLAMILGVAGHPVYGFQATGLKSLSSETIESIAEKYVQELKTIFPRGPYIVLGWSLGGIIAYEMTKQLECMGEREVFLVILDTPPSAPSEPESEPRLIQLLDSFDWHGIDRDALLRMNEDEAFIHALEEAKSQNIVPQSLGLELFKHMADIVVNLDRALSRHRTSGKIKSNINLYVSSEPMPPPYNGTLVDPAAWNDRTEGKVNVMKLPGNHLTLVTYPNVIILGEMLTEFLRNSKLASDQPHANGLLGGGRTNE
ncbi:Thioesterase domain-containing protein [Sulfobacillus thermosulfidooxidans DSM 9293]|uniref:Thioesterase domain-containing protein n=1 Tax=Sulfobacillus thermosulfidooxidans (strain DSM 9293 / VKM B-1269 / AT-1) TaxID=929705 RepID=A0A1W1WNQ3_SULTA|nr:thioesterase domain-containing protein [Sulfobacillus thermosulfidooxidans]SMC07931.1 Thioesterase domain-containing protein [Sulfobacillus thermosulfidooxidans DSM 9293]